MITPEGDKGDGGGGGGGAGAGGSGSGSGSGVCGKSVTSGRASATSSGRIPGGSKYHRPQLLTLSNQFYSLIPHISGGRDISRDIPEI